MRGTQNVPWLQKYVEVLKSIGAEYFLFCLEYIRNGERLGRGCSTRIQNRTVRAAPRTEYQLLDRQDEVVRDTISSFKLSSKGRSISLHVH